MNETIIKLRKPEEAIQSSGLAPFITQGTVATDNLSFMMKNAVVIFGTGNHVIEPLLQKPQPSGTSDEQHSGGSFTAPGVVDEKEPHLP